jgi:galactose mutarotase-like enzyme
MQTKWKRADQITTEDYVVTGGEHNPLHEGGKRRAWKVAERVVKDGGARLRLVLRGKVRGTDSWITQAFPSNLKLRVKNGEEK